MAAVTRSIHDKLHVVEPDPERDVGLVEMLVTLSDTPAQVIERTGAKLVTRFFLPISYRTLEAWPLTWRRVSGKAVGETAELFAQAQAKLDAAAPIRGGRRQRVG